MQSERPGRDEQLTGIEAQLAALAPAARLDRDRLMFAAGQRIAARQLRFAHSLAAVAGMLCVALTAALWTQSRESFAGRAPSPAGSGDGLVGNAESLPAEPLRERRTKPSPSSPLALSDAPTTFRLLQAFARGTEDALDAHATRDPAAPPGNEPPPSKVRDLMKRYLEAGSVPL